MKVLIIGGNRFVGLRVSHLLDCMPGIELHILNRTGQVAHVHEAAVFKGDRNNLELSHLDRNFDVIYDFACFNGAEAEATLKYFKKVGRYIFISSVSVYDQEPDIVEDAFSPKTWDLTTVGEGYQHGKRQAEAVFMQKAEFPTLCVRFPFLLGPDDYTNRLNFHIDHARQSQPIQAPNPEARFSVLHSEDAAEFLLWARERKIAGPLNVAAQAPLTLRDLLAQIQLITGHTAKLGKGDPSPYCPEKDWYVNVNRLETAGFQARPLTQWLPELIGPSMTGPRGMMH